MPNYIINPDDVDAAWRSLARGRPGLGKAAAVGALLLRAQKDRVWFESLPPAPPLPKRSNGRRHGAVPVRGKAAEALQEVWAQEWERTIGITRSQVIRRIVSGYVRSPECAAAASDSPGSFAGVSGNAHRAEILKESGVRARSQQRHLEPQTTC